jgi:hypothetical protein
MKPGYRALTLAIYPTSKGFSWIAFENPFTIYDYRTSGSGTPARTSVAYVA